MVLLEWFNNDFNFYIVHIWNTSFIAASYGKCWGRFLNKPGLEWMLTERLEKTTAMYFYPFEKNLDFIHKKFNKKKNWTNLEMINLILSCYNQLIPDEFFHSQISSKQRPMGRIAHPWGTGQDLISSRTKLVTPAHSWHWFRGVALNLEIKMNMQKLINAPKGRR